jgi:hypothetical protein
MVKGTDRLNQFRPTVIRVECLRCKRMGEMQTHPARQKHGNITLDEFARRVAKSGGCSLAAEGDNVCSARVVEPSFDSWARLHEALEDGWSATLYCQRRYYALKRVQACPATPLDVETLVAALGSEYRLDRLELKARCPQCGTDGAKIHWHEPAPAPDPGGTAERAPVLQLRETKAVLGRKRFRVI